MIERHTSYKVFLRQMVDRMSSPSVTIDGERAQVNPLANIDDTNRTRPAHELLRAWALVGDVLTFYQERIANESTLSTARDDTSAYAIARTVGYEPRPAVSAATWLAFSVQGTAARADKPTVTIPKFTAVGNVPDPGKLPAIFETSAALEAVPAWSLVPCAVDDAPAPAKLRRGATRLVLDGVAPVPPGTALAIRVQRVSDGTRVTLAAIVAETTADAPRDATLVRWTTGVPFDRGDDSAQVLDVHVLDARVRPFGALARPFREASAAERRAYTFGGIAIRSAEGWSTPPWSGADAAIALAVAPSGIFAITSTTLIRYSRAGGWSASSPFPGSVLQTIVATPDGRLAVGTTTGQLFVSIDDGFTWLSIGDGTAAAPGAKLERYQTRKLPAVPVRAIAIDESVEAPVVYVATDRGVATIALNGEAWTWRNDGLPGTDAKTGFASAAVTSLTFADDEGTLMAATTYGVYRSSRAHRWSRVQGLGTVSQVATLPEASIAVGPGGVFRSVDGGGTWEKVRDVPGVPRCLAADVTTVAVAAGTDVYTSDDSGRTWVRATTAAGTPVFAVAAGPAPNPAVARPAAPLVPVLAVAAGPDGTVAAGAPLVDNPSAEWPDLWTSIWDRTITLEREVTLAKGDLVVVSLQDDDSVAEAHTVASSKTTIVTRFGLSAMCTTVVLEAALNPVLADPRNAVVHIGARIRQARRVKREAPEAPRDSLAVPRGLPKLERRRRIAVEGRPPRVMLRGTAGGTLRLAAGGAVPYAWPAPAPGASADPDHDVTAAAKSGERGVVLARVDGVWKRDDVTSATSGWTMLPRPPIAVTGLATLGETLYACGRGPRGRRGSGVYAYTGGAWTQVLAGPIDRLVVTAGDSAAAQRLWACGKRGLYQFDQRTGAWHSAGAPLDDRAVRDVAADGTTVLAACDDGVYVRGDAGWRSMAELDPQNGGDAALDHLSVNAVALGGEYWYAGTRGSGAWRRNAAASGRWEPLGRHDRTGDVRRLLVRADGTVLAAVRGRGLMCDGTLLLATLASNVRALVPYETEGGDFVLAFAGVPLCPTGRRRTVAPMRRHIGGIEFTDAECQTLDAGMLPPGVRSRVEQIVNLKLDAAEVVVENAGEVWRLEVSEIVPVYRLRRNPSNGDVAPSAALVELRLFELETPAAPFGAGSGLAPSPDRVCWHVLGTTSGEPLLAASTDLWYAPAAPGAAVRSELASVAFHGSGQLELRGMLANAYDPRTVTIAANVVPATHGATVGADEVIASGDSSKRAQTATLAGKPLTNVMIDGTPVPDQLQVWVRANLTDPLAATEALANRRGQDEAVRWNRVANFSASTSRSPDYVVRQEQDGSATLTFGDGEAGRRLPTGTNNVVARYRVGGGSGGNLAANRLTLFQSHFSGAERVWNPVPAIGGVDAERIADIRQNVSHGLVALDRVVSRFDLEDYVRAWPGVAKVYVAPKNEPGKPILVTYASPDDLAVDAIALKNALQRNGAANWNVTLSPCRRRHFVVEAHLLVGDAVDPDGVLDAASSALLDAYSFDARSLRDGVTASAVIALLQRVRGVSAAVLDAFYESGTSRGLRDLIGDDDGPAEPASLLTLGASDLLLTQLPALTQGASS